jgi:hypothetical protein
MGALKGSGSLGPQQRRKSRVEGGLSPGPALPRLMPGRPGQRGEINASTYRRRTCCRSPRAQRRSPEGWRGFATACVARKAVTMSAGRSPASSGVRTRRCKASTSDKGGTVTRRAGERGTKPSWRPGGTRRPCCRVTAPRGPTTIEAADGRV